MPFTTSGGSNTLTWLVFLLSRSTRKPAIKAFLPSTKPAASHSPNRAIISGAQAAGGYHVSADGVIITQFVAREFGGDAAAQTGAQISQGAHGCQIMIGCCIRGVGGIGGHHALNAHHPCCADGGANAVCEGGVALGISKGLGGRSPGKSKVCNGRAGSACASRSATAAVAAAHTQGALGLRGYLLPTPTKQSR